MDFETQKERAIAVLNEKGVKPSSYAPPMFRLLWRFGAKVPPPHFISFAGVLAAFGAWAALSWGLIMEVFFFRSRGVPPHLVAGMACLFGFFFGLAMAARYAWARAKHRLPSWDALGQQ